MLRYYKISVDEAEQSLDDWLLSIIISLTGFSVILQISYNKKWLQFMSILS